MNRSSVLRVSAATVLGLTMLSGNAIAQQKPLKEQLVGMWTPVSVDEVRPDGSKVPAFGPNPKGILIFDSSGRFAYVVSGSGRPKFASNNRMTGTPEENKAVSQGSLGYAGRYSVSETDKALIFHVEASTFPNAEGAEQKRFITLTGDELRYTNPATTTGGKAEAVWKRAN